MADEQRQLEGGRKLKPVKPLEAPVIARQHTPVYRMHRYFARRPWNVFEHIIKHYTDAGDIILDPFCGGGVTVYEGLKLRRRVIGIDLNPLAAWITEMQVEIIDLDAVEKAFESVAANFAPIAEELYSTTCDSCGEKVTADWFEWSNTLICPGCGRKVILAEAKKLKAGTYECPNEGCISVLAAKDCQRAADVMVNKKFRCPNCKDRIAPVNEGDKNKANEIIEKCETIVKNEELFIPDVDFPDGDRARDDAIFSKGVKKFSDLFTKRNLLALARLKKLILEQDVNDKTREALLFIFSASLRYCNRMTFRNEIWRGTKPLEWPGHAYWLPDLYLEPNIIPSFINRKNAFIKGKKQTWEDLDNFPVKNGEWRGTYTVCAHSSESLTLPSQMVDCVITDPPFGGNVQYAELSDFWVVWLPEIFRIKGVIDNTREAIETRHNGFPTAKDREHYEDMLHRIFLECHRVLKDDGYMVMTFHNRDVGVWMALHRAARRAGFKLPEKEEIGNRGLVYQDFIENFKHTFHTRATGSMLGDFILTFKKVEIPEYLDSIIYSLSTTQQKEFYNRVSKVIRYHGGLDTVSMNNLMAQILIDMNLIHRFAGKYLSDLYKDKFVYLKDTKKWYNPEDVSPDKKPVQIFDVIPVERVVEQLIYSYLHENKYASVDDLLKLIYTALVNSERPGIDTVKKVLNKYCEKKKIKGHRLEVYIWKTDFPRPVSERTVKNQIDIFGGDIVDHNRIIEKLAVDYINEGFQVYIGLTETKKDKRLKELSVNLSSMDLGIPPNAFKIVREIDLLVLKGTTILKAIEVVTSFSTFNKAINDRFRNLLTVTPSIYYELIVMVNESEYDKALAELNSPANVKAGLNEKIRIAPIK